MWLVKIWVRLGLLFFCKKVFVSRQKKNLKDTPTILACNHPNSFLDALIIGSHYPREVYYLARGDVFDKPFVARILRMLNMIPVYRISEGKENLINNQNSFEECIELFKKNKTILIFSEGVCINEWKLRPLKKGTARIAYTAWHSEHIDNMVVLPVFISYNSFNTQPKTVWIKENNFIKREDVPETLAPLFNKKFNTLLEERLETYLLTQKEVNGVNKKINKSYIFILAIPAFIGWCTQKWLYNFWRSIALKKTHNTVFFESALFGMLLIIYPIFILAISSTVFFWWGWLSGLSILFLLPFTAWCYKEYKT